MFNRLKRILVGAPLPTHVEHHERLNVPLGLAVFASDILSSSAYATEEILIALMAAPIIAHSISLPVTLAICVLLIIVVTSYRQVIRAYPDNGGAYVVAKENLGTMPSLVVGSALLLDYMLTVAVSVSAGVAALTSTGWLSYEYRVPLAVTMVVLLMLINLRGVKESGTFIAFPAYGFILGMFIMLGTGVWMSLSGHVPVPPQLPDMGPADLTWSLGLIALALNAFSHGCAALTGAEAVSDGVKAFKEPAEVNANRTLVWMAVLLCTIFIGLTYLANTFHIMPKEAETVVSQVARSVFGGESFFYFYIQLSTMTILFLAANTSFAGFPRLASMLAADSFLPRQLMSLGDKLVFSNGIVLLGLMSILLIILYNADTHALIPLYAVGVFITFTVAQGGMVVYQIREKKEGWRWGLAVNAIGALVTGLVALLLAYEKFTEGAWLVLIAIPLLIVFFYNIRDHYRSIGRQLALPVTGYCPTPIEHTVLVLVSSLNRGTIPALEYARTISNNVEAVHVELNSVTTTNLKKSWDEWGCGVPLTVLKSQYRSLTEPLLAYVSEVESRYEHDVVTIIIPEFVTKKWWHNLLHNQTALLLKALLRYRKGKVVTTVRYHLEE